MNNMVRGKTYPFDDEFKRLARIHQFHFRENELHIFYDEKNPQVILTPESAKEGLIFYEGYRELIRHKTGKFGTSALFSNLLRSEHIPYNLFTPMEQDLDKAAQLFSQIIGVSIAQITDIKIEYAGIAGKANYLDDGTSFDTFVSYVTEDGSKGGIGIEVKYTENGYPIGKKEKRDIENCQSLYHLITQESGYFIKDMNIGDFIKHHHLRQIWRNHILGYSMINNGDIALFHHIHLYPEGNSHFHNLALPEYKELLTGKGKETFIDITYEELFLRMSTFFQSTQHKEWINYLYKRYIPYRFDL